VNDLVEPTRLLEIAGGMLLLYGIGAAIGPTAAGLFMDTLGPGSLMTYFAALLIAAAGFAAYRIRVAPVRAPEERRGYVSMVGSSQAALQLDPRVEKPSDAMREP